MKHQVIIKLNYRWLLGIMLSVALLFSVVSSFVPLKVRATGIGPRELWVMLVHRAQTTNTSSGIN